MTPSLITVVIPLRQSDVDTITVNSLESEPIASIISVRDEGKGANYARNKGWKQVDTEYTLFSDYDIEWRKGAIQKLVDTLKKSGKSYAYGAYYIKNKNITVGEYEFDAERLKRGNYISTMCLVKTKDFCGFDENITNFQDWDAWLTMLEQGKEGAYCGEVIFDTDYVDHRYTHEQVNEFENIVRKKHGIET